MKTKISTKREAVNLFIAIESYRSMRLPRGDEAQRGREWNGFIDALYKDNQISEQRYNMWTKTNPFCTK